MMEGFCLLERMYSTVRSGGFFDTVALSERRTDSTLTVRTSRVKIFRM
jgi:hypothetical protein